MSNPNLQDLLKAVTLGPDVSGGQQVNQEVFTPNVPNGKTVNRSLDRGDSFDDLKGFLDPQNTLKKGGRTN